MLITYYISACCLIQAFNDKSQIILNVDKICRFYVKASLAETFQGEIRPHPVRHVLSAGRHFVTLASIIKKK